MEKSWASSNLMVCWSPFHNKTIFQNYISKLYFKTILQNYTSNLYFKTSIREGQKCVMILKVLKFIYYIQAGSWFKQTLKQTFM